MLVIRQQITIPGAFWRLRLHYSIWRNIDKPATIIEITTTKMIFSFSLDRFWSSAGSEFKSLKQRIATNAIKKPKAPVAFHSQVLRCFRLAIAPMMLPEEITIKTKVKNGKNDSSESTDSIFCRLYPLFRLRPSKSSGSHSPGRRKAGFYPCPSPPIARAKGLCKLPESLNLLKPFFLLKLVKGQ